MRGRRSEGLDTPRGTRSGCEPPWTTVQVGTINGGTAVNILPSHCEFLWEYRGLPNDDPESIITAMQEYIA
ncbi:MAG: peptidase dimerization domain-containing protein, partial [Pseudomonadota bacterium]